MESSSTIEDDDRLALNALLSNSGPLPNRNAANIHSHSQQLRAPKRRHHHHPRNHSLDNIPNPSDPPSDDDDDDDPGFFHSYSSSSTPSAAGDDFPISQSIPEFIGSGGGTGVFRLPKRGVIHPTRPPCLELRPHPLRETQVGKFLRTIACTDTQLWAGQENGVRFWRFQDAYEPGLGGKVRRGEEDAAPFHESSNTPPTMCLLVDCGTRLVWSGHKDGKIRSWKMDPSSPDVAVHAHFKEGLSWQAHPRPVISMVISSYGDLWSGGEGGLIRIWPWETIEKSLSLRTEEKHMAGLLVERSFIDLRSQVSSNGNNSLSSSEIKCLYSDHVQGRIWIAQPLFFSLWDARTKELLKIFNIDGQLETRIETQTQTPSTNSDSQVEEGETNSTSSSNPKTKSSSSKKEKSGFLQRSRNALMGAADAVRRVASRGSNSVDDSSKRTEALVATPDGMVWSGCTNGALILWDGNGNRLHDVTHHPCGVQCFCVFGARIYIGYVSGMMQVMDLEGNIVAAWMAHDGPVIKVAAGNGFIFSLASHGGIRAWNVASPSPLDDILRTQLAEQEAVYSRRGNLKLLIGTWNVGQGRATQEALMCWLSSVSSDVGIVVVGLQEVEMGAGFLAMSAAKESVGLDGSSVGNWWLDAIGKALDENMTFERMGSRQLAGLLIGLWVRKNLRTHVGDVDAGAVPCGFGRAIGNKGGVGLRIRVLDRLICFVNCHLAAHLEGVNRRNADFDHIFRNMAFSRSLNQLNNVAASVSISGQMLRSPNQQGANPDPEESKTDLADADMVIFFGDFNYRLFGISYDEARDLVSQRSFDWLREKDQLRAEMKAGKVFHGMREAIITFPPTYKFERGRPGLGGYDAGEKKRIPAWCDRVIYRDNRSGPVSDCSLECPIISSVTMYEACMDVTESDHKPVRCKFHIRIAHVERSSRRQAFGEILKSDKRIRSFLDELRYVPDTVISTSQIVLQNQDTAALLVTNKCNKSDAIFKIICQGQSTAKEDGEGVNEYHARGSFGFPRWLEVNPAAGIIKPEQSIEVKVHHEEFQSMEDLVDGIPQNWWCEDARDRQVILNVLIRGYTSTETKTHVVQVHHTISPRGVRTNSKSNSNKNLSDTSGLKSHSNKNMDTAAAQAKKDPVVSPSKKDISSAPAKKDTAAALTKKDISSTSGKKDTSSASAKKDKPSTPAKKDTSSASAKKDTSSAPAKKDTSSASAKKDTSSASAKKDTSSAPAKKDTSSALAKKDTSSASAKKDASSASAEKDTSSASSKKDTSSSSAKKETSIAPAKKDTSGASFKRDTSVGRKK